MDEIAAEIEGLKLDIKWLQNELAMLHTVCADVMEVVAQLRRNSARINDIYCENCHQ